MGDPWRMVDANLNRAAEALRCLEDVARFGLGLAAPSAGCKSLRHMVSQLRAALPAGRLLASRDVAADPGPATRGAMEDGRRTLADVAAAAAARAGESLRALEEALKVASPAHAAEAERIRYRSYEAAAAVVTAAGAGGGPQWRLCLLLTESLCRRPWLEVLRDAVRGGVDCVQLREKSLDDRALLERARRVVEAARAGGAAVVINDRPDVALACGADGVHLGRRDLPVAAVRRLGTLVVGVSTHSPAEAEEAVEAGADLCGVGAMFASAQKPELAPAGPAFMRAFASRWPAMPHLAIGGIGSHNVEEVLAAGARGVAVSGAICGAAEPGEAAARLRAAVDAAAASRAAAPAGSAGAG